MLNYRGITLPCTFNKHILNKRLGSLMENIIQDYKIGFQQGRSMIYQLFQQNRHSGVSESMIMLIGKTMQECMNLV